METDYCIVLVTGKEEDSKKIQNALVKEKLAACVNSVPGINSLYTWKGRTESETEVLLIIKTKKSLLDRLITRVRNLHSYGVPEIIALPVIKGNKDYLAWVGEVTE
jgi:periplasmic divalent cation tolerance protein